MIIGYTAGGFDLFHVGHLNLLRNCKALCDKLIVGVSTDQSSKNHRKKSPVISFEQRIEIIRNIKQVDLAVPQTDIDKYQTWKKLKFDILFQGDDRFTNNRWKTYEHKLKRVGVKVIYLPYTNTISTLEIKKRLKC